MNCIGFNPFHLSKQKTLTSNVSVNKSSNFVTVIKIITYLLIIFSIMKLLIQDQDYYLSLLILFLPYLTLHQIS